LQNSKKKPATKSRNLIFLNAIRLKLRLRLELLGADNSADDADEKSSVDNRTLPFEVDRVRVSAHSSEIFDVGFRDHPDQLVSVAFARKSSDQLIRKDSPKFQHSASAKSCQG